MAAVLLSCLSAFFFGALAVAARHGLRLGGDPSAGAVVTASVACAVSAAATAVSGTADDSFELAALWPFLAIGALVPGVSQIVL